MQKEKGFNTTLKALSESYRNCESLVTETVKTENLMYVLIFLVMFV